MSVLTPRLLRVYSHALTHIRQCLVLPRHRNETLLATALTGLDHCQNGTTTFPAINITQADAPQIIEGFYGNVTFNATGHHHNRTNETKARTRREEKEVILDDCSPTLFFPDTASSSDGRKNAGDMMVILAFFVGVVGFANGLVW